MSSFFRFHIAILTVVVVDICMVAPAVQLVTSKPSDVGRLVRISVQSHAFRYERKNVNPTWVRIELATFALAGVQVTY